MALSPLKFLAAGTFAAGLLAAGAFAYQQGPGPGTPAAEPARVTTEVAPAPAAPSAAIIARPAPGLVDRYQPAPAAPPAATIAPSSAALPAASPAPLQATTPAVDLYGTPAPADAVAAPSPELPLPGNPDSPIPPPTTEVTREEGEVEALLRNSTQGIEAAYQRLLAREKQLSAELSKVRRDLAELTRVRKALRERYDPGGFGASGDASPDLPPPRLETRRPDELPPAPRVAEFQQKPQQSGLFQSHLESEPSTSDRLDALERKMEQILMEQSLKALESPMAEPAGAPSLRQ